VAIIRETSPERIKKLLEPYARDVGKLVAAWNQLQEHLGELFSIIVRKDYPGVALAIWHSTQSDRSQRQMLGAAKEAAFFSCLLNERAKNDIKWLLDRSDELAHQRNDAIHAPIAFYTDQDGTQLVTEYFFGNPRASSLKDKKLSEEFSWYEKKTTILSGFALRIAVCLRSPEILWLARPPLPNRGE
jgi:hypothetical protein